MKVHPAYIEILADGYLPLLYHYKGAADPVTHILSKTGLSDYVVMTEGKVNPNETTFFKKELRFLEKNAHSFVVSKYDLSDCIPVGEFAALTLRNGEMNDRSYPLLCNFSYTQDEIEEKAEKESDPPTDKLEKEDPKSEMEKSLDLGICFIKSAPSKV